MNRGKPPTHVSVVFCYIYHRLRGRELSLFLFSSSYEIRTITLGRGASVTEKRTSAKKKARELAKYLRGERPDYAYLKSLFQQLRTELEIEVPKAAKKLPYVPTEEELKRYYEVVWKSKNFQDMMIVKTLMYTGIRVSELVNTRLTDIDFHY